MPQGSRKGELGRQPTRRARSPRGSGERLRDDLLLAAEEVLARSGSEEPLSLRAVARAAGVAPTAVYLHFEDREALVYAVLERLFANLAEQRNAAEDKAAAEGGDDWERLRARSHAYVRWGVEQPGAYRVLYEGRALPSLSDPREVTFGQAMLDRTTELIEALARGGRADPVGGSERAGLLLWTVLHGIVSLRINKDTITWPDPKPLGDEALEAFIRPRRKRRAAKRPARQ
jgi:AcrR family transcriptional regulator